MGLHPWKLTCPLKMDYFKKNYIFLPLSFLGYVNFWGSKYSPNKKQTRHIPTRPQKNSNLSDPRLIHHRFDPIAMNIRLNDLLTLGGWRFPTHLKYPEVGTPPWNSRIPWKLVVGRLLSFWECLFSGDMLVVGRVVTVFFLIPYILYIYTLNN